MPARYQVSHDERTKLLAARSSGTFTYSGQGVETVRPVVDRVVDEEAGELTVETRGLHRKLSARQVQMISIGEFAVRPIDIRLTHLLQLVLLGQVNFGDN